MQTFLPLPSFAGTAEVLDDRRLGKQRVETLQILRALVWPAYGWKRHPAVTMWRGFTPALVAYGLAICDEWRRRGHRDSVRASLLDYTGGEEPTWAWCRREGLLPPWLGDPVLHRSHRSALLRKAPEQYREVFDEPDDLDYAWPAPVFPQWPMPERFQPSGPYEEALAAALATPGLAVWRVDAPLPPLGPVPPPVTGPPSPPGASIARLPSAEDLAAIAAEPRRAGKIRFLRPGQRLPAPASRFTWEVPGRYRPWQA